MTNDLKQQVIKDYTENTLKGIAQEELLRDFYKDCAENETEAKAKSDWLVKADTEQKKIDFNQKFLDYISKK